VVVVREEARAAVAVPGAVREARAAAAVPGAVREEARAAVAVLGVARVVIAVPGAVREETMAAVTVVREEARAAMSSMIRPRIRLLHKAFFTLSSRIKK
jgi:hypothetical protein